MGVTLRKDMGSDSDENFSILILKLEEQLRPD